MVADIDIVDVILLVFLVTSLIIGLIEPHWLTNRRLTWLTNLVLSIPVIGSLINLIIVVIKEWSSISPEVYQAGKLLIVAIATCSGLKVLTALGTRLSERKRRQTSGSE